MKKFTQYLNPPKDKKELSLTEKVWLDAKKKIEEDNKQAELSQLEEKQREEELRKKLIVEKIVDVNVIKEEFIGKDLFDTEEVEEVLEPQPLIEQVVVQGEVGPQGPQGLMGPPGPKGDKGDKGEKGDRGIAGLNGLRGEKGEQGIQGESGPQGEQGLQGVAGQNGKDGVDGQQGVQGLPGRDGIDGKDGAQGPKGDKGDRGENGQDGKNGLDGKNGEPGPKGDKGDRGEKGEKGDRGEKGDKGDVGSTPDIKPLYEKFNKLSLDINKKVGRIVGDMGALASSGGSGSYWLNDLGDTDYSGIVNATNNQVLTYDSTLGKWTAKDQGGGAGVGTLQQVTENGNTTTLGITTAAVQLNLTSAITVSTGQMAWNAQDLTVDVGMANGVTLQLGQEQYIKVKASEDIADGETVMFSGADGEHILAARCNTAVTGFKPEYFIGVATQNLTRNGFGYITTFGKVHGLNTLAFQEGEILYVDANTVGGLSNTAPTLPRPQITVAAVTKRAGGDGHILVRPTWESDLAIAGYTAASVAAIRANASFLQANTPSYTANSASSYANSAFIHANAAFDYANTITFTTDSSAGSYANSAFIKANTPSDVANSAASYANSAFLKANTPDHVGNSASSYANSAFLVANSAFTSANGTIVWNTANAAFLQANTPSHVANSAASYANAAFTQANTAITTSGGSINGQLNVSYSPATTVNAAVQISAANTKGGTGYSDFLSVRNVSGGATNPYKWFRLDSTGILSIVNSAYTATLMTLDDSGNLALAGNVTSAGVQSGYNANRPAFRITGGNTVVGLSTTQNGTGQLNYNNWILDYNQGGYLNYTSGTFTAPVAGLYQINLTCRNAGDASYSQLICYKNGNVVQVCIEFAGNSTMNHTGGGTVARLAAGDTLIIKVTAGTITFDGNDFWSVAYLG